MRTMTNEQSFLWKHERKGSLGTPECGLEDYTDTLIREVNGGVDNGFIFPRAWKQRLTSVNKTKNLHVT
jgi:hypothetical protein